LSWEQIHHGRIKTAVVLENNAANPVAVFTNPVVLERSAFTPIAVQLDPVVFDLSSPAPMAVF
jgi:hypothetical protein